MVTNFTNIEIGSTWYFSAPLAFSAKDVESHPYLSEERRAYKIISRLGGGGVGLVFLATPCSPDGKKELVDCKQVVLKFPNIDTGRFSERDQHARLQAVDLKAIDEWRYTHLRLHDCRCATHIIDLDLQWLKVASPTAERTIAHCIVTVQEYLKDFSQLNDWMAQKKLLNTHGRPRSLWRGLQEAAHWKQLCLTLASALEAIHQRRVVHGDIWPDNIFVRNEASIDSLNLDDIRIIDFGESSSFYPTGVAMRQNDHAYRAPERNDSSAVSTELIDVYSFGKLALYLAAGGPLHLPENLPGRSRRERWRTHVKDNNPRLLDDYPALLDIVTRCAALDPVDRPSMSEVVATLKQSRTIERDWGLHAVSMLERVKNMQQLYEQHFSEDNHVLRQLIDQRILSLEETLKQLDTELVRTEGSRDEMIRVLVSLMNTLESGDSWTALTSPSVWQSQALGLDGRYLTATVDAVRRRAKVHRAYMITVQETGEQWWSNFIERCKSRCDSGSPLLRDLIHRCEVCLREFRSAREANEELQCGGHGEQFSSVLKSLKEMAAICRLDSEFSVGRGKGNLLCSGPFDSIESESVECLYIGLIPLPTRQCVQELRVKNPASLMRTRKVLSDAKGRAEEAVVDRESECTCGEPAGPRKHSSEHHSEWHLVITDIQSRDDKGGESKETSKKADVRPPIPTLKGVRVYRSVMEGHVPKDRIMYMNEALRKSINIGGDLSILADCASEACAE